MSGKKGMVHYRAEVKEEAVRLFQEEGLTYQAIAERLGIRKAERIEKWVHDYRQEGALGLHKAKGRPRKQEDQAAYIARLEMENALLKKFHEELRKLSKPKRGTE
jgi:transposase-like protein